VSQPPTDCYRKEDITNIRHSAYLYISLFIFTFSKRLIGKIFIIEININKAYQ